MASKAQREAVARYNKGTVLKSIRYNPHEVAEYQRIEEHCKQLDITYQRYVKDLIRRDLERMEKERGEVNHESTANE